MMRWMRREKTLLCNPLNARFTHSSDQKISLEALHTLFAGKSFFPEAPTTAAHLLYRNTLTNAAEDAVLERIKKYAPTSIIHVGLGGSILGVRHLAENSTLKCPIYFIDVPERTNIENILAQCDLKNTIVIVVTKSGTTQEALQITDWLKTYIPLSQFFGVTANVGALESVGIPFDHIVPLDPAISGRFSTFSPTSLSLKYASNDYALALEGAKRIDMHFLSEECENNLAAQLALFMYNAYPICHLCPYWPNWREFIWCAQQLHMESLGKHVDLYGNVLSRPAGTLLFGELGIRGQHSYFQYLHGAGIKLAHIFIVPTGSTQSIQILRTHALSQYKVFTEYREDPHPAVIIEAPAGPMAAGSLLALFENAAIAGALYTGVHPFTQPGVEAGKKLVREALYK